MDSRKIAEQYRLAHWAQVMQERSISGKNVRQFCMTNNIRENVFYYWQKRLREAICTDLVETDEPCVASGNKKPIKQNNGPKGFVQLIAGENISPLIIDVKNCKIAVTNETDLALLAKVCGALGSI